MHRLTPRGGLSWSLLAILVILVVALGLRLNGVNWDAGYAFHPDERDIYMRAGCMYDVLTEAPGHRNCGYLQAYPDTEPGLPGLGVLLDRDRSPLNPHWFPLGSILIYVLVFFRSILELFTDMSALDMRYVGRPLSALADVGSVFLVYLLGRRMYGQGVGLLAAGLTALAVIHVQNSHFYRPETFSLLFVLASFWAMLRMVERRRLLDSALLGLLVGLALAPKVSVLPLVLPLALAYGYRIADAAGGRWSGVTPGIVLRVLPHAALAGLISVVVFFASSPYALLDFGAFLDGVGSQVDMARHAGTVPFTIQYIDTQPFLYQIQQTSVWGLGLPLGIVAWLAVPFTVVIALARPQRRRADLLLLAWVVPTFLFLETFEVKFLRYVFPLIPFLILMASRMLIWLVETSRVPSRIPTLVSSPYLRPSTGDGYATLARGFRPLHWSFWAANPTVRRYLLASSVGLLAVVVAATAFYSLAFQRVYAKDHPAVEASRWINQNVPPGTAIVSDNHWDEFVPDLYGYQVWQFPVYNEPDSRNKMDTLAQRLSRSEYLVFYSNRPYSSVSRAPDRYPRSNNYYRLLFQGELGYRLVKQFTNHPQLAGVSFQADPFKRAGLPAPQLVSSTKSSRIALNLGYADDNVTGYDHPQVMVFRNQEHFSNITLLSKLAKSPVSDRPDRKLGLMLSDQEKDTQRSGGTWSEIIHRESWTNQLPVLAWLLAVELVYLAALPLAMFIFRPLPDRGIVLARIFGLLGVSYVSWLLVSLGWLGFSVTSSLLGLLAVALLSSVVLLLRWREIKEFLRQHWRLLLVGEVIFLLAFLAFVAIRAANPDLWHPYRGGEKPMELAYLNAVIRSTSLPPFDPWFAGGYMNYYYWGYFVLAGLVRVTGILPTVAFNLAVPLFFALTFTGAYSVVYNLTEGLRRSEERSGEDSSEADSPTAEPPTSALRRINLWSPIGAGLVAGLFMSVMGNLDGAFQLIQGTWHKVVNGGAFPSFDFWRSSRMIPTTENMDPSPLAFWVPEKIAGTPDMSFHITEFPFFTFLFADLHAHMMVIPFTLLVIGLGLSLVLGLRSSGWVWPIAASAALALAMGALWVINSWDYPSYLLLTLGLLALAVYLRQGGVSGRLGILAVMATGVVVLSVVAFLPFHAAYETFQNGLDPSKWRTPIDRYLAIHGLFLFVIGTFLVYYARPTLVQLAASLLPARLRGAGNRSDGPLSGWWLFLVKSGVGLGLLMLLYLAVAGFWTAAMLAGLLVLAGLSVAQALSVESGERPFLAVPLVLLGMALAISLGVDIVRLEGDIGRMNTLFKYYLEVWVLFSLASAFMLWYLGYRGFFRGWRWSGRLWVGVLAVLLASSLVYTGMGTRVRLADRFNPGPVTLDGTAYMNAAVHVESDQPVSLKWDREAIRWLQDNAVGSPVVLEAHHDQYHWSGRIATYTGLPTVLGWPWHQIQQRMDYDYAVRERATAVAAFYNTSDLRLAQDILKKYDVEYIVVGELERVHYSQAGLDKFAELADAGLISLVFHNEGVTIYQSLN